MAELLEQLSSKSQTVFERAAHMAEELGSRSVTTAHLFLALLEQDDGPTKRQISLAGGDPRKVQAQARRLADAVPKFPTGTKESPQVDDACITLLKRAVELSVELEAKHAAPNHILLALREDPVIANALEGAGVNLAALVAALKTNDSGKGSAQFEHLTNYATDLTARAADGKLDRVFGRDGEIRQLIQVLSRRIKNNPIIIGEPGVGKTALVEGLALRIANADVPDDLRTATLFSLDMGRLVAGTKFRGEFEERLKNIVEEASTAHNVVLFIDEIHTLIGTGGQEGGLDAANLLKPALSRGQIRCIGATTLSEYRKRIEKDTALVRRFQQVVCEEPTPEQTISILRGLKDRYEVHHGIRINDAAINAAVKLSHRYMPDRQLPDKAIDIIDQTGAARRMEIFTKPEEIEKLDRSIFQNEIELKALDRERDADKDARERSSLIEAELTKLREQSRSMTEAWQREKNGVEKVREAKKQLEEAKQEIEQKVRALGREDFSRVDALLHELIPGIEGRLAAAHREVEQKVAEEDFARAGQLQHKLIPALEKERDTAKREMELKLGSLPKDDIARVTELQRMVIPELERILAEYTDIDPTKSRYVRSEIGEEDVAQTIARHTGIPVSKMLSSEREKLKSMEDILRRRVVGQDEPVIAMSKAIRRSRAGLQDPGRPIASFLMLGPTGVGKTELAKALAEFLFDDEKAMMRIDMSEYMEKHAVSRLTGPPPGYVGFEEGGVLTNRIKRKPYSVVLFDEVEKAHTDIFNVLLQVLDDGRLTDNQGQTISFANTVIILTSNLGADAITESKDQDEIRENVMVAVKKHFRPEFLNRLDETVIFKRLALENMRPIVDIQLSRLQKLLKDRKITLKFDPAVRDLLAHEGHDPMYGARPLKRLILKRIHDPLSEALLDGRIAEDQTVDITLKDDEIIMAPIADGVAT